MDTYEVENPLLLDVFSTDDKGRITLGRRFADKDVKIVVAAVTEDGTE